MPRATLKQDGAIVNAALGPAPSHSETAESVLAFYEVDAQRGLDLAEVARRRAKYGSNQLLEASRPPVWLRFLGHFFEPMVAILITAAVISGLSGDVIDTLAILAIVLLNGLIGFIQEERSERGARGPPATV